MITPAGKPGDKLDHIKSDPTEAPDAATPTPSKSMGKYDVEKTSPQIAGYMGPEEGPFECEHCVHWLDPDSCNIVSGPINSGGCCNLFQRDPDKVSDADGDQDAGPEAQSEEQE